MPTRKNIPTGVTVVWNPYNPKANFRIYGCAKDHNVAAAAQDAYNEELQQPLPNRDPLPTTSTIPASLPPESLSPPNEPHVEDVASNHSVSEDPHTKCILDHCRVPNVVTWTEEDRIQLKKKKVATLQLGQLCFHGADRASWRTTARTLMRGIAAIVRQYDADFHFWAYNRDGQPTEFDTYPIHSAHPDMIRVFVLEKHQKIIMEHCKDLFYCDCYGAIYCGLPVEYPKLLQNGNQGRGSAKFVTVELPNTAAANGSTTQRTPQRLSLPQPPNVCRPPFQQGPDVSGAAAAATAGAQLLPTSGVYWFPGLQAPPPAGWRFPPPGSTYNGRVDPPAPFPWYGMK